MNVNPADIEKAQCGDEDAFERVWGVVRRYIDSFLISVRDPSGLNDLEDFELMAALELWERLPRYDPGRSRRFLLWAARVIRNKILREHSDRLSSKKRNRYQDGILRVMSLEDYHLTDGNRSEEVYVLTKGISEKAWSVEDYIYFREVYGIILRELYRRGEYDAIQIFLRSLEGFGQNITARLLDRPLREVNRVKREVIGPVSMGVLAGELEGVVS